MAVELHLIVQTATGGQSAPVQAATPAPPAEASVREQIRQSINEARAAAQEAAQDAAREAARDGKTINVDGKTITIGRNGTIVVDGRVVRGNFPGETAPPWGNGNWDNSNVIPPQAVDIAMGFFTMCAVMVVGWPLARAFGRRLERRAAEPAAIPSLITDQLQRIEQAVDAMSVEVERISESQRFMAKLQTQPGAEQMALPHERR